MVDYGQALSGEGCPPILERTDPAIFNYLKIILQDQSDAHRKGAPLSLIRLPGISTTQDEVPRKPGHPVRVRAIWREDDVADLQALAERPA